jgi:hypothetical protein
VVPWAWWGPRGLGGQHHRQYQQYQSTIKVLCQRHKRSVVQNFLQECCVPGPWPEPVLANYEVLLIAFGEFKGVLSLRCCCGGCGAEASRSLLLHCMSSSWSPQPNSSTGLEVISVFCCGVYVVCVLGAFFCVQRVVYHAVRFLCPPAPWVRVRTHNHACQGHHPMPGTSRLAMIQWYHGMLGRALPGVMGVVAASSFAGATTLGGGSARGLWVPTVLPSAVPTVLQYSLRNPGVDKGSCSACC